ncbi:MAG: hypothetical protein ACLFUT_05590 [Desulfobacteraceae bacterium]
MSIEARKIFDVGSSGLFFVEFLWCLFIIQVASFISGIWELGDSGIEIEHEFKPLNNP